MEDCSVLLLFFYFPFFFSFLFFPFYCCDVLTLSVPPPPPLLCLSFKSLWLCLCTWHVYLRLYIVWMCVYMGTHAAVCVEGGGGGMCLCLCLYARVPVYACL